MTLVRLQVFNWNNSRDYTLRHILLEGLWDTRGSYTLASAVITTFGRGKVTRVPYPHAASTCNDGADGSWAVKRNNKHVMTILQL